MAKKVQLTKEQQIEKDRFDGAVARKRCIRCSNPATERWAFKATSATIFLKHGYWLCHECGKGVVAYILRTTERANGGEQLKTLLEQNKANAIDLSFFLKPATPEPPVEPTPEPAAEPPPPPKATKKPRSPKKSE